MSVDHQKADRYRERQIIRSSLDSLFLQVMSWDKCTCWPKGFTTFAVDLHVVLQRRWLTLTKPINIQDSHQVVQLVVGTKGHGLPNWALWALAISQHAVHTITTTQSVNNRHENFHNIYFENFSVAAVQQIITTTTTVTGFHHWRSFLVRVNQTTFKWSWANVSIKHPL